MPTTLFVVEPHPVTLLGLKEHLQKAGTLALVGTAATVEEAKSAVRGLRPQLVLIDIEAKPAAAYNWIQALHQDYNSPYLALLSEPTNPIRAYFLVYRFGVRGLLPKTLTGDQIILHLQAVAAGAMRIEGVLYHPASAWDLSPRELDVLDLLLERKLDKEIADQLGIAYATVRRHAHDILTKLGCQERNEIILRLARTEAQKSRAAHA